MNKILMLLIIIITTTISIVFCQEKIKIINPKQACIDNHIYYEFPQYGFSSSYTLKVDDNGKPCKCE